jgi:chromosome segregation ATPase
MANIGPREGITYEQVAAQADLMVGQGVNPTIRSIREAIGGSPNTVHKHLTSWRIAHPQATSRASELPTALTVAITAEITRATTEARADVEAKLVQVQTEAAELSAAGETLEAERNSLTEQLIRMTAVHNTLAGKSEEQTDEIVRLTAELERERTNAEQGRIEIAQSRNKIESLNDRMTELTVSIEKISKANEVETKTRINAEQSAAVLQAKLDASIAQVEELRSRENKLIVELEKERTNAEQARLEMKEASIKLETQAAKLAELTATIEIITNNRENKTEKLIKTHADKVETARRKGKIG